MPALATTKAQSTPIPMSKGALKLQPFAAPLKWVAAYSIIIDCATVGAGKWGIGGAGFLTTIGIG